MRNIIPIERVENKIHQIRGQKVMLDMDLAELYNVPTGRLSGIEGAFLQILCFN